MRSRPWSGAVLAAVVGFAGCGRSGSTPDRGDGVEPVPDEEDVPAAEAPVHVSEERSAVAATFVGSTACGECHPPQGQAWSRSDHGRAMQAASDATVLGDFGGVEVRAGGETFRFHRVSGGFAVEVRRDGAPPRVLPVTHTFGVWPLQQYLVDVGEGRRQALLVAWDARPDADGGQRWYHLQDGDIAPVEDPRHWSGLAYNWNRSCAECHSTEVSKNYDPHTDRYATTFEEVSVGCEACHGPGSAHVAWARSGAEGGEPSLRRRFPPPGSRRWAFAPGAPIARLTADSTPSPELGTCAPCHSRRAQLSDDAVPFDDAFRLASLDEGLYFDDGQIRDEVFVYGSFLQSKMYARGVVCSDCHDPHSASLRVRDNALCSGCHRPEVFDTPTHHFHPPTSAGARCTACHMPERVYMGVDARADHRFGIPRPVQAARVGAPDPCRGCHRGWSAQRAQAAIAEHRSVSTPPAYPDAIWAARHGLPQAEMALLAVVRDPEVSPIQRATALGELSRTPSPAVAAAAKELVRHDDPLVRRAVAALASSLVPTDARPLLQWLLDDPVATVRMEAASGWLNLAPGATADPQVVADAVEDYVRAQRWASDGPDGLLDLAHVELTRGQVEAAQGHLERAIAIAPTFTPAYLNLADLHRTTGREVEAEAVLQRGIEAADRPAPLHHALGLAYVRKRALPAALQELERAFELSPEEVRFGYVYAIALFDGGQGEPALAVLEQVHHAVPNDRGVLAAAAQFARELGKPREAERYAAALATLNPAPGP